MPLDPADLVKGRNYYIAKPAVVLRKEKTGGAGINHLLLGDWLRYLGEHHLHEWTTRSGKKRSAHYAKVRCRGDTGWLELDEFVEERALEVNFVDVGQGDGCHIVTPDDQVLLIDAGISDNMERFLSWRYNLRRRNVAGAPDFDPNKKDRGKWTIDYVVMSHPDEDHYGGLTPIFRNPKLGFGKLYHNGIVERPKQPPVAGVDFKWDLGGLFEADCESYLFDHVASKTALKTLLDAFPKTTKRQMTAFRALFENSPNCAAKAVGIRIDKLDDPMFLPDFEDDKKFSLRILGPVLERKDFKGQTRTTLRRLGNEGETKNGHSVIFRGRYGNLTLMVGGDLNEKSQDFLLQAYAGTEQAPREVARTIKRLRKKKPPLSAGDLAKLDDALEQAEKHAKKGREIFGADVAKACHHGSQHVLDEFIIAVNAIATVLSSGDQESHSHPRPDALGAYGKFGRGRRPLIFSTELARSTREFSPLVKSYLAILGIVSQIEAEQDEAEKERLIKALEAKRDRNVAVYGMITMRALGDTVIIAQKLEEPRSQSQKWDIYQLEFDAKANKFAFDSH